MNDRLTVVWSGLIAEFVPWRYIIASRATAGVWVIVLNKLIERVGFAGILLDGHYKIFCVNGNTGFRNESRIFYFIHLQNEEAYERKESSSA